MSDVAEREQPKTDPSPAARRWSFGNVVFDEDSFKLFVGGKPVELERKSVEVLRQLMRRAGKLVTKDELLAAVWPGRILTETVLTKCVFKLREALDDREQHLIVTVHGRGYRLEAAVRSVVADAAVHSENPATPTPPDPQPVGAASAAIVAAKAAPTSPAAPSPPARRLAAIMFTDLVGYSALAHRDEALAIELLELHRGWVREILPKHDGIEIETIGDAFLIEFTGALAAVECAVAIQQRFTEHNTTAPENRRMQLRIGIHLGDVEHKDGKVMGDGVNIASRIHGMAEPGGICLSESVYQAVRNRSGIPFQSLGRPQLKNIATAIELYRIGDGPLPTQAAPIPVPVPNPKRSLRPAIAAALVLAAVALGWALQQRGTDKVLDKSVAVLPFTNMSSEKDSQYFSDGMQDEVLTAIAKIRDLKVISRTSVERYRGPERDLRAIAKALDVATVVEGAVQRAGNRVRINVQLIDASNDAHLWAESYDREITDIFAVQSEIAHKVAEALKATLLPQEAQALAAIPTQNQKAYDLYLQGHDLLRQIENSAFQSNDTLTDQAQDLFEQALVEDPAFALAAAGLARLHMWIYYSANDSSESRLAAARSAAERALALRPELGEAHLAMGVYHYWGHRDYARAQAELERARQALPNSADVAGFLAAVARRQGRMDVGLALYQRSAELDPQSASAWRNLAETYYRMRRSAEALAAADKAVTVAPNPLGARILRARNLATFTGELDPLREAIAGLKPGTEAYRENAFLIFRANWLLRDYAAALKALDAVPRTWMSHYFGSGPQPKALRTADLWALMGDPARARRDYEEALTLLTAALPERTKDPAIYMLLGQAYAGLGRKTEALSHARKAVELLPVSRDALNGPALLSGLAAVCAAVGETDEALALLRQLQALPFAGINSEPALLRIDPAWDPLRGDPQFQELLKE